jgi:hypothetical protein
MFVEKLKEHPWDPNLSEQVSNDTATHIKIQSKRNRKTRLTSDQVLIKLIHAPNIRIVNLKVLDLRVLNDPTLLHRLGQRDISMLQTPSHHQLRRRAAVLLTQLRDDGMFHTQRSCQRGIRLDDDVVILAVLRQSRARVEGVDLDLIDGRSDSGFAGEELIKLFLGIVGKEKVSVRPSPCHVPS